MIQGSEQPRFPLEASQFVGMLRKLPWKDFDGDVASEPGVPSAVDLTHTAGPEGR